MQRIWSLNASPGSLAHTPGIQTPYLEGIMQRRSLLGPPPPSLLTVPCFLKCTEWARVLLPCLGLERNFFPDSLQLTEAWGHMIWGWCIEGQELSFMTSFAVAYIHCWEEDLTELLSTNCAYWSLTLRFNLGHVKIKGVVAARAGKDPARDLREPPPVTEDPTTQTVVLFPSETFTLVCITLTVQKGLLSV